MPNVFKQNKSVNEHPNRNNFDLSKKVNASFKFGALYPVYCQPVVPGDSFDIDVAYNLKLMPIVFPVQTRMRAHMHFYYVRNKNLWTNWQNWISNLVGQAEHPHPYISIPDTEFKNGSIHDFLGVPTSVVRGSNQFIRRPIYTAPASPNHVVRRFSTGTWSTISDFSSTYDSNQEFIIYFIKVPYFFDKSNLTFSLTSIETPLVEHFQDMADSDNLFFCWSNGSDFETSEKYDPFVFLDSNPVTNEGSGKFKIDGSFDDLIVSRFNSDGGYFMLVSKVSEDFPADSFPYWDGNKVYLSYNSFSNSVTRYDETGLDLYSRYLHLNALPYRAYESICNVYYRNEVVNPFRINGEVAYNRYNTNLGDGADNTCYSLQYRNYELDFLTSALPSPQQGVAPLVGMTALGDITIEDENGITTAHAEIDNDGTISKVVLTSPAASVEHARTAMNLAACGMSINDFRATNALQRLLETNIRKGYKYLDFIAGHFGKEPNYNTLDIPEFIGGFSRDVNVSTVVSNADTLAEDSGAALGQYGAYAGLVGGSNHSVRHYCDDYGYIIGILSVVPTPCYSQLLPKHMIAPDNFLDYYFPEMSQLGLQPITYREVAPIQSMIDSLSDANKTLDDTFGYQRPNYDMVSAVDECHGEFRDTLKDYVINRQFDTRPELGADFIQVNPEEINDIFVDTNPAEDTILGEIAFKVFAKRPVPRVVIPNLGK